MVLTLRRNLTLLAAVAAASLAAAWLVASPAAAATRPFSPSSFWNAPLAPDTPLDAQSATYVAGLQRQLTTTIPWINTTKFSSPVYTVDADQPTVRVKVDNAAPASVVTPLQNAFEQVPVPAG